MPLSRGTLTGFVFGCATGIVVAIGGLFVIIEVFWEPALRVSARLPDEGTVGGVLTLSIVVSNPDDETTNELDKIEVENDVLERFRISPTGTSELGEPVARQDSLVWFPGYLLAPGSSEEIEFAVEPLGPGLQVLQMRVCNAVGTCSRITSEVQVAPE